MVTIVAESSGGLPIAPSGPAADASSRRTRRWSAKRAGQWQHGRPWNDPRCGWTPPASACACCTSTPTPTTSRARGRRRTAKYVAEGVEVMVATCTGGERGSILNPAMDRPDILANIGRDPAGRDGPGPRASSASSRSGWASSTPACPRAIRCHRCPTAASPRSIWRSRSAGWSRSSGAFRPQVMTTYDENGGYPHPDHIRCHEISVAAYDAAADPDAYPERGRALAGREALLPPLVPLASGSRRSTTR